MIDVEHVSLSFAGKYKKKLPEFGSFFIIYYVAVELLPLL